jgi:uncharacterized protein (DUF1697 family)
MVGRGGLSREALVGAFERCGALEPRSFMATGNVILRTARPARLAENVSVVLREPVFMRSFAELATLEASDPFARAPATEYHERFVTFFPSGLRAVPRAPLVGPRGDFQVFAIGKREAFGQTRLIADRPGNPVRVLEKLLGAQVTTRNWDTIVRVLRICRGEAPSPDSGAGRKGLTKAAGEE